MDIFSTAVLIRLVANLATRYTTPFVFDRYFQTVQQSDTDEICFDTQNGRRRISPFVSYLAPGKVVESNGYTTSKFSPAYVKDKRIFDPDRAVRYRAGGEQIAGNMPAGKRIQLLLAQDMLDQLSMLARRQEVMAIEALRKGGVTVEGDKYPKAYVDYKRDPALTITLSGAARWGQVGVSPLDNLETWGLLIANKSGAQATDLIMDVDAWRVFIGDATVKAELDRWRNNSTLTTDATTRSGATYKGQVRGWSIWVYADWYVDPVDNTEKPMLPSGTVILTGPDLEGVRAYGAIKDEKAGLQAMAYFPKSWLDEDPAVRYLMLQSAPLPVPFRINASACATVI